MRAKASSDIKYLENYQQLALSELKYQKEKLELELISKEEYDKIKDFLKQFID